MVTRLSPEDCRSGRTTAMGDGEKSELSYLQGVTGTPPPLSDVPRGPLPNDTFKKQAIHLVAPSGSRLLPSNTSRCFAFLIGHRPASARRTNARRTSETKDPKSFVSLTQRNIRSKPSFGNAGMHSGTV